ncbi:MAG: nucleoside phosphorylase [Chitinophagales bacterium]|nr:nucleoside phosphorylase [Chitinophagales bacterium]MDW8274160.1 nucleoside phosphorylase [Chitinophagales bacterium]
MRSISQADFILNADGSMYHVQLLPDEIADIIFTVGDPERVSVVSNYFDEVELARSHREIITHTGYIGKKRVSVISTGMGTDNIDIVMNELDALVNIDFETRMPKDKFKQLTFIRLGTAGALQRDISLGSVILAEKAVGFDVLMSYYRHLPADPKFNDAVKEFLFSRKMDIRFYTTAAHPQLLNIYSDISRGVTISAPGFYAPQGRRLRITPVFENMVAHLSEFTFDTHRFTNMEMETAGIYALGEIFGHRCLSFNAILANRLEGTFCSDPQQAVRKMIEKALERVEYL